MSDPSGIDGNAGPTSEVEWLRSQIAMFERRLGQVSCAAGTPETAPSTIAELPPPPPAPIASTPAWPTPSRPAPWRPVPEAPVPAGATARAVGVAPPPPWMHADQQRTTRPRVSLPAIEPLLKWSGLVLMFLSALFLVSTAIQRGWIGPELQLLGAAGIGASLIAGGLVIGQRRSGWDVPLVAVGVATLAATATAGWQWLELWSHEPWVIASFVVLGLSITLTDRLNSPGVGGTGLVATMLSLGLLGTSVSEVAILLTLALLMVEASSLWQRLASLHLITVAAGLVSFAIIAIAAVVDGSSVMASGAITTLAFWVMPIALTLRGTLPSRAGIEWRPTVDRLTMMLPPLFTTAWAMTDGLTEDQTGRRFLFVGGLALVSAGLVIATERFRSSIWVSQLMGGAAAVTVGTALLLDGPALLVGLAVQTAGLILFVHLVVDRWATVQAGFMAAVTGLLTLTGMLEAIEVDAPFIDDLVHLAIVVACGGWAWWELRSTEQERGRHLAAICFGGALLWPVSALTHVPQGQALISAVWAALGFAMLTIAFTRPSLRLAQISLVTLAVVMAKLLSVDLAAVDTFWRVALFFVLGGVFLFASFRVGTALRALDGSGARVGDDGAGAGSDDGPDHDNGLAFQK